MNYGYHLKTVCSGPILRHFVTLPIFGIEYGKLFATRDKLPINGALSWSVTPACIHNLILCTPKLVIWYINRILPPLTIIISQGTL